MEINQPNRLRSALESPIIWGCFGTAATIVITVVAAMIHDIRWILVFAWPFSSFAIWEFARICSKRKGIVWSATGLGTVVSGVLLGWLYIGLAPIEAPPAQPFTPPLLSTQPLPSGAEIAEPAPPESPPPSVPQQPPAASLPSAPIQSRLDRFIFDCDVPPPQTLEEDVKQKESLQKSVQAWAATIGVSALFSEIKDGTQITIEAKTKESKARFISMGIAPGITKIILEARRIDRRKVVVAHADVPKKYQSFSRMIPDPSVQQIIDGQKLIARFLGAPEDACRLI